MPVPAGTRFGVYEILSPLGSGGMGEVYKARDTRLNRFVAIKVLPADRVPDERRKQRFIQEAQAASALNHPNIVTIHDIASDGTGDCLVMEYVAGKTLDLLIPRTGMPLRDVLKIALQVAEGISVAHGAGIVHRDLKPSNIMVADNGLVKILDFGLAKLTERNEAFADEGTQALIPKTEAGTVMGTAAYMSPEQAEGKPVDARTDIFSFGAVLYEMASGRRAFHGDSQAAIMAAVLDKEPKPLGDVAPAVPQELERIILRCLRKDPARRQRNMTDVRVLLEDLREESESGRPARATSSRRSRRLWPLLAAAAALAIGVAAASLWLAREGEKEPPTVVALSTFAGSESHPSFSPDGNQVVFSWNGEKQDNWDLYVKMTGSATALRLTKDAAEDTFPAWSRDGRQIAFLKSGPERGIYVISPLGGQEQKILDFDAAQAAPAWSKDGEFLVAAKSYREEKPEHDAGALFLIPAQGGESRPVLVPTSGRWYQHPAIDPAGRSLAFASCGGPAYGRYCDISLVALGADLRPQGGPRKIATVSATINGLAWTADGRSLIYSAGNLSTGLYLWRVDAAGGEPKRLEIASQGAVYPAVALKGNRLAFSRVINDTDIWQVEAGGTPRALLVSSMLDASPQFSPDGRRIAFASGRGVDRIAIWLSNADGGGPVQLTRGPENYHGSPRWSPDGRWVAFDARGTDGRWNIKVVESGGGTVRQLTSGPFTSTVPGWSRDGKGIYFASDRTGRFEIWRVPAEGGTADQITRDGGYGVFESTDAKTLYYTKTGDPGGGPLYARSLGGSDERQVVDRVVGRGFAVLDNGIYYLDRSAPRKFEIRLHEFATGRSRLITSIEGELGIGFAVSPDRKTFLVTWVASPGSDLMLIENFR